MADRSATTTWKGSVQEGRGETHLDSSDLTTFKVTAATRFGEPEGHTSPEEMLAAAHASCWSMALSSTLSRGGSTPEEIRTTATCTVVSKEGGGFEITRMKIEASATVPGIDQAAFDEAVQTTNETCPVSNALKAIDVQVSASLA